MPSGTGLEHKANLESRGWTVEISGPHIDISSNDISISNGDNSPSATDNTDFGTSNIGESIHHSFLIRNVGQYDLHLSGTPRVVISGANPSDFSVNTLPASSIGPWGGTSNFQIIFSPKEPGLRQAVVSIVNDGIDNKQPYIFSIQGTGNPQISDTTLSSGTISCFGSETVLTLAGDGTEVHFESGSLVNLIAAQSVFLLPGFNAHSGSNTHVWITTDGTFCDEPEGSPGVKFKSAGEIVFIREIDKSCFEKQIKVYPNPNIGNFTVQIENFQFPVSASVVNNIGEVVYKTVISGGTTSAFNLPQLKKGFYFVIVNNDQSRITKKMVVE
jgi:hypothetical protein